MAEVGLVTFARVALRVGQAALSAYRSKFSKPRFTQPQRLAMLCFMRYEDWTFREAEVRLAEHRELRAALGLDHVPDYTTLYRVLRWLDETVLEQMAPPCSATSVLAASVSALTPPTQPYSTCVSIGLTRVAMMGHKGSLSPTSSVLRLP
jgi:hypothetical protein